MELDSTTRSVQPTRVTSGEVANLRKVFDGLTRPSSGLDVSQGPLLSWQCFLVSFGRSSPPSPSHFRCSLQFHFLFFSPSHFQVTCCHFFPQSSHQNFKRFFDKEMWGSRCTWSSQVGEEVTRENLQNINISKHDDDDGSNNNKQVSG